MSKIGYVKEDFVKTYSQPKGRSKKRLSLVYGDKVEVIEYANKWSKVRSLDSYDNRIKYVKGELKLSKKGVLKISMVDVQQGDGIIIESPEGKIVFVDGGDNKLFARHAAARFNYKNSSATNPVNVEAIIITHGDADHFDGLNEIVKSEKNPLKRKRLFLNPKRVYHNGLVKSKSKINNKSVPDAKRFGKTVKHNSVLHAIDLYDDTREAPEKNQNTPFKDWHKSLDHWEKRSGQKIETKRVSYGMDESSLFDFFESENINIELLGPFTKKVTYRNKTRESLPFLNKHSDDSMIHLDTNSKKGTLSASHTINGHSIAFRLVFGNFRMLFTGDLNKEALDIMMKEIKDKSKLACEVFKAPHHGSHDFAVKAIKYASPIVSIVSSGDESAFSEHIHPRATLLSALGNNSRTEMSIILSTELAAFFSTKDYCYTRKDLAKFFKSSDKASYTSEELRQMFSGVVREEDPDGLFYGFERTNFGIIHMRTDGKRLLVFTHSGKKGLNEAYAYTINTKHEVKSEKIDRR